MPKPNNTLSAKLISSRKRKEKDEHDEHIIWSRTKRFEEHIATELFTNNFISGTFPFLNRPFSQPVCADFHFCECSHNNVLFPGPDLKLSSLILPREEI